MAMQMICGKWNDGYRRSWAKWLPELVEARKPRETMGEFVRCNRAMIDSRIKEQLIKRLSN